MRGNPSFRVPSLNTLRSIPAHAGQPSPAMSNARLRRVYPRACGATIKEIVAELQVRGLSPRMRGNLLMAIPHILRQRSIPAHAGQPTTSKPEKVQGWVYPRACGATLRGAARLGTWRGLSPRMRGNLYYEGRGFVLTRSIPAHAGQPSRSFTVSGRSKVYPRACGATPTQLDMM